MKLPHIHPTLPDSDMEDNLIRLLAMLSIFDVAVQSQQAHKLQLKVCVQTYYLIFAPIPTT